jgi:phage terminase small subunit
VSNGDHALALTLTSVGRRTTYVKSPKSAKQSTAKGGEIAPAGYSALSPKQLAFCAQYLVDLNGTQAAIRAGYSKRTAGSQANELLTKPEIQTEVQRLMAARAERVEVTTDRVLQELKALAFYDPGEIGAATIRSPKDIAKLPEHLRRCIIGWNWDRNRKFTLKLASKTQQLDLIGRHLKMFTDKIEHSGPGGGPIQLATTLSPAQMAQVERIKARREALKGEKAE